MEVSGVHGAKISSQDQFVAGEQVEVRNGCAWFPATVIKKIANNIFLVKYPNSKSVEGVGCLQDNVEAHCMRPLPPDDFVEGFYVSNKVEASFNFGWWSGVVTKVVQWNRYLVCLDHDKSSREFTTFQLRNQVKSINGRYIGDSLDNRCKVEKDGDEGILLDNNYGGKALEKGKLPFTKTDPMWRHVESMDVYKAMPQEPHFRPLLQLADELRERQALYYMMCFSMLVDSLKKARLDEPKSILEAYLKTLMELEEVGFDTQHVRPKLEELMRHKEIHMQLDGESRKCKEEMISEHQTQESLNAKINELLKRREMLEAVKKKQDDSIAALESVFQELAKEIQGIRDEFSSVAGAPWK